MTTLLDIILQSGIHVKCGHSSMQLNKRKEAKRIFLDNLPSEKAKHTN